MVEINKNYSSNPRIDSIPERDENLEDTGNYGIPDVT